MRSTVESEERAFLVERAQNAARRVMTIATRNASKGGRGSRGGRGASRGGARGRGRGGARGDSRTETKTNGEGDNAGAGDKRKRAIEPGGPSDSGVRGQAIPTIQATKKAKTDEPPVAAAAA